MEDFTMSDESYLEDSCTKRFQSPYLREIYQELDALRKDNFQLRIRVHLAENGTLSSPTMTAPTKEIANNNSSLSITRNGDNYWSSSGRRATQLEKSNLLKEKESLEKKLEETQRKLDDSLGDYSSLCRKIEDLNKLNTILLRALQKFGYNMLSMEEDLKVKREITHEDDVVTSPSSTACTAGCIVACTRVND